MLSSGCDVCEGRVLLPEEVRIGERATCPSLGSPDGVALDSKARHVSSGRGVFTLMNNKKELLTMRFYLIHSIMKLDLYEWFRKSL